MLQFLILIIAILCPVKLQTTTELESYNENPLFMQFPEFRVLCAIPANDYACCKMVNQDVPSELRCYFALKLLNDSKVCDYV